MRSVLSLALVFALAAACGPKAKNGTCPASRALGCRNGQVCSHHPERGCQVCQCRPVDAIDTANDPDDMNPPIPVR